MSRGVSPNSNSMTYEINKSCRSTFKTGIVDEDMLSQLKVQIFEKDQSRGNYENLLAKYNKLQEDLQKIIQIKKQHESDLRQQESDERNIVIADLKTKNENLFNELNERIALNKKLYNENNSLFRELEAKKTENQSIKEEICRQEEILRRLTYEKEELEKKVYNLNQMKEKQEKDILNFSEEINKISYKNDDQNNMIKDRNGQNLDMYNQINEEKIINKNLLFELRDKENHVSQTQQKLDIVNENVLKLKTELDSLTNIYNRNNEDINTINNNLIKESSTINQLIIDNKNMNNDIHDRDIQIKNLSSENEMLKQSNKELNEDTNSINKVFEKYRSHLILLATQNKKIASEIQLLVGRDTEVKAILDRTNLLREIRLENDRLVTNSIEKIKYHIEDQGSPYRYENNDINNNNSRNSLKRTYSIDKSDDKNNNFRYESRINEKENEINVSQSFNKENENRYSNIGGQNMGELNVSKNIDMNSVGNEQKI